MRWCQWGDEQKETRQHEKETGSKDKTTAVKITGPNMKLIKDYLFKNIYQKL